MSRTCRRIAHHDAHAALHGAIMHVYSDRSSRLAHRWRRSERGAPMKLLRASIFSVVSCVVAIAANACGSDAPTQGGPGNGDDTNSPGKFGGDDGGLDPDAKPCTNLCLRQKEC